MSCFDMCYVSSFVLLALYYSSILLLIVRIFIFFYILYTCFYVIIVSPWINKRDYSYTRCFKRLCSSHNLNLSNVPNSKTHKDGNTLDFLVCDDTASCLITHCSVDYDAPNISHHFPSFILLKLSWNAAQLL